MSRFVVVVVYLVRCGNHELTFNDEFPLFTADNMTFPCAKLFILQ